MKAFIRRASRPLLGKWVLAWQTSTMKAPAFRYFHTRQEAQNAREKLWARKR